MSFDLMGRHCIIILKHMHKQAQRSYELDCSLQELKLRGTHVRKNG